MNICIPVTHDQGPESLVSAHFGSAPLLMIVDTESGSCRVLSNRVREHGHGMCQPLTSLAGESLGGLVVSGIGRGAVAKLQAANIQVYRSEFATVAATVAAFNAGTLRLVEPETACGHHSQGRARRSGGPSGSCQARAPEQS